MNRERILGVLIAAVLVAAAVVVVTKTRAPESGIESAPAPAPLETGAVSMLIIGIEGLEPSLVARFSERGQLPNLTRLMQEGVSGEFQALERGIAPEISWTSLATGMKPENQGVGGQVLSNRGELVDANLVPSSRTVDAIWTHLSAMEKPVGVVGWPGTWPVETIDGVIVGQYSRLVLDRAHGGDVNDRIQPASQQQVLDALVIEEGEMTRKHLAGFLNLDTPMGFEALVGQNYTSLARAYAGDNTNARIAMEIAADPGVEYLLVHLEGLDGVCQRFWHYMDPESVLSGAALDGRGRAELMEQSRTLGSAIERYYSFLDTIVGVLAELVQENGTIAIVTDHGYVGVRLDRGGSPLVGFDMHSSQGFWILKGPSVIESGETVECELFDFAPTVMEAAGVAFPEGTDGRILEEVLR
ncbi:alkaline phosphatase family protein [bacterium]|nr:alkaline phosphatase family protein [bacterium]